MKEQINFDKKYEAYKSCDDKVIIIDGVKFFKIIEKRKICNNHIIAIPNDVFTTVGNILKDNIGNTFTVGNPVHYSFKDKIPEWYFETVHLTLEDITIDKVGEYITLVG